jgi:hypothetical protein
MAPFVLSVFKFQRSRASEERAHLNVNIIVIIPLCFGKIKILRQSVLLYRRCGDGGVRKATCLVVNCTRDATRASKQAFIRHCGCFPYYETKTRMDDGTQAAKRAWTTNNMAFRPRPVMPESRFVIQAGPQSALTFVPSLGEEANANRWRCFQASRWGDAS